MLSQNTKFYIKHLIALAILIAVLIFVLSLGKSPETEEIENIESAIEPTTETQIEEVKLTPVNTSAEKREDERPAITESATVIAGDMTLSLSFIPGVTFYDALVWAKNEGRIEFSGKNYPGLGFFVTDIGTLHAGGGRYLLYYVNGEEATVGVSSYELKGGDVVEWKLE